MVVHVQYTSEPIDRAVAWWRVRRGPPASWREPSIPYACPASSWCLPVYGPSAPHAIPPNAYERLWWRCSCPSGSSCPDAREDVDVIIAAASAAHEDGRRIEYPPDVADERFKLGTQPNVPLLGEKGSGYKHDRGTLRAARKRRSPDVLADLMRAAFGYDVREDDEPNERREDPPASTHRENGTLRALGHDEPEFDHFLDDGLKRDLDRQSDDWINGNAKSWRTCTCDRAPHSSQRAWYRDHGIVGYSRRRDIAEAEDYSDKARQKADEQDLETPPYDPTADHIEALLRIANNGEFAIRHVINGVSIREIARTEGIKNTTLQRRIKAVLADLRDMDFIVEMKAKRDARALRHRKDRHDGYGCPCGELLPTAAWSVVHAWVHRAVNKTHRTIGRRHRRADWRMGQDSVLGEGECGTTRSPTPPMGSGTHERRGRWTSLRLPVAPPASAGHRRAVRS